MRIDFDVNIEKLNKYKLKVIGEQFVLNAQIGIMTEQNEKVDHDMTQKERTNQNKIHDLTHELKLL